MKKRLSLTPLSLLTTCIAFMSIWLLCAYLLNTPALPYPHIAWIHFIKALSSTLPLHLFVSLLRIFASLFISLVLAIPLGMLMGKIQWLDHLLAPFIYLTYPIPKVVLLPIFIIIAGIGDTSKILLTTTLLFYQLLITTRDASKNVSSKYIDSFRSLGASSLKIYQHIIWPVCLPKILSCTKISLGTAINVLFLTETYATSYGIGYYIMDALTRFDYGDVYAGIIGISIVGLLLFLTLERIEYFLCRWKYL